MVSRVFLAGLVCCCLISLKAQEVSFRHLTVEDGLSQNTINCIYQDHYGFMWFGTQDGLNRFDGYEFTTYRSIPEDSATLSHNWIWDVIEDDSLNLWIATWDGLTRYDRAGGAFQRFFPDSSNNESIRGTRPASLVKDNRGKIWTGLWGGGLNVLDPTTTTFTSYRDAEHPGQNYPGDYVRKVYIDREGFIWIGTWNGLWKCRIDQVGVAHFNFYVHDPYNPSSLGGMRITSFCEDQQGRLWIGTLGGGLNLYLEDEDKFKRYVHNPDDPGSISSNDITSLEILADGSLWIGTISGGLNRFDPANDSFTSFLNDPSDQGSISSDNVYSLYADHGGVLWVGAGGLNLFNPDLLRFEPTGSLSVLKEQLEGIPAYAILEDSQGSIWVGTNGNGLVRLQVESGELRWYRHQREVPNGISSNNVSDIVEDPQGKIWISTNGGGLNRLDPHTDSWMHFRESKDMVETRGLDNISGIVADEQGKIWIATAVEGMICYDLHEDSYRPFRFDVKESTSLSGNYLLRIFRDSRGELWLGTWGAGLNRYDPGGDGFIRYLSDKNTPGAIPDNIIHSIWEEEDANGRNIWIGTSKGLAFFNPDLPEAGFTPAAVNSELPSRSVYGMLIDSNGKHWISSNAGISRFNPSDSSFMHYTYSDGLPGNEYNAGAFLELGSGLFAFGGTGGLLVFHPDSVYESSFETTVALTSFSVLNEQLYEAIELNAMEMIALSHKQNFFSFEFASMDFSDPGKNRFMYKMDGIDEEWILSGERNFASYTKIDPGDYMFRVRATNGDGHWSPNELNIKVVITPPFWQSWWFRSLLIAAGLLFFYTIHLYRIRRVREIERLRTQIASDLHDDIGSALTRISVHSQQILARQEMERVKESGEKINELSRDTISTMSDIVWSIDARNDSLADFLGRMQDLTHTMLSEKDISVSFKQKGMDNRKPVRVEVRQNLYYIFKEAIHNIARHSNAASVEISIRNSDSGFHMLISDDGCGFNPDTVRGGNGLKNMKMRALRIGAILDMSTSGGCSIELKMKGL